VEESPHYFDTFLVTHTPMLGMIKKSDSLFVSDRTDYPHKHASHTLQVPVLLGMSDHERGTLMHRWRGGLAPPGRLLPWPALLPSMGAPQASPCYAHTHTYTVSFCVVA